jgi:HD superfamily phosphohydrolase
MSDRTVIRDAVHKDIVFDPYEKAVINSPEFQRLRGIRQLGLAHLLYPCAQHSRFEHSLGVAHAADLIIRAVRENCGPSAITEPERRFIRVLALVHDIGHVPFGHTLEDERPVFPSEQHHDDTERLGIYLDGTALGAALSKLGKEIGRDDMVADVVRVMKRTHEAGGSSLTPREALLADVVGNTICADLLDYLIRDTLFTGLQHRYDERIISAFKVKGDEIYLDLLDGGALRHSLFSEIVGLLRLRYTLGERIYFHPTKSVASAMISKAVEMSGLTHRPLSQLRDEELLYLLENAPQVRAIKGETIQHPEHVSRIAGMLRNRALYIRGYSVNGDDARFVMDDLVNNFHKPESMGNRREVEERIAKEVGAAPGQVIIFCPHNKMAAKAAMVKVQWPGDPKIEPLEKIVASDSGTDGRVAQQEIEQLKRKHQALWRMTVFVDPALHEKVPVINEICCAVFGVPDREAQEVTVRNAAEKARILDELLVDEDRGTVDYSKLGAMVREGAHVDELPRVRPDNRRDLAQQVDRSRRKQRSQPELPIGSDTVATIRDYVKRMPPSQRATVEPKLEAVLAQIEALPVDARTRALNDLSEQMSLVASFDQNRHNPKSLLDALELSLRKAAEAT